MSAKEVKSESIKPYEAGGEKTGQVSTMFNNIAKYYDFLNHFLSLGIDKSWRKKAIAVLKEDQPQHILDVATGTGDLAIELVKTNAKRIVGLDISDGMLEVGRQKIKKRRMDDLIEMVVGDSEDLPFDDNSFDAITVAFGIRNFENLDKKACISIMLWRSCHTNSKPTVHNVKKRCDNVSL